MKLLSISIIFSIVCISQVAYSQSGDQNPQMGTWKLNETESKIIRGKPTAYIQVFEPAGDQVKVTMDGIDRDGKRFHNEWVGKFDGNDYPLTGKARQTRSYKRIDDRTLEVTNKKDGKITFHTRHVVSADGKSRTLTPIEAQESQGGLVYHKQIEESGKPSLSVANVANANQSHAISQAPVAQAPVAPDGTYVLIGSMHIVKDGALIGLHPGTVVQAVRDNGKTFHVIWEDSEFDIDKRIVTNDLNVAQAAFRNDQQGQAKIASWMTQQQAAYEKQKAAELKTLEGSARQMEKPRRRGNQTAATGEHRNLPPGHHITKGLSPGWSSSLPGLGADNDWNEKLNQRRSIESQVETLSILRGNRWPLTPKEEQFQHQIDRLNTEKFEASFRKNP